jgi:preprotein translocase subunit YajC
MTTAPLSLLLFTPSGQGAPGMSALFVQVVIIFAIFYFLIIRPQKRQRQQHENLLKSLQRGDKILTSSGIVGEVVHIKDDEVTIRSGEAKFVIMRSGIASITNRTAVEPKPA